MNPQFVQYLVNKLQTGNLKSIHLNALPGRFASRLDIADLDILKCNKQEKEETENEPIKTLSQEFLLDNLLSKSKFQFKINFDEICTNEQDEDTPKKLNLLARRLNSMLNQNEDNYLEHGIKTFSFAYPLLIKRSSKDPNKIIKAPVIIWKLDIKRSNKKQNEWIISQSEDEPVYFNEVLISHIANEDGIVIEDSVNDFLEDKIIDEFELLQIINKLLKTLGSNENFNKIELESCPPKDEIEEQTQNNARIVWSGIFGLFKTQKQSIIRDTANLAKMTAQEEPEIVDNESFKRSNNTSVPTDPSQEEIVRTLNQSEYKLIQGPPGTGKSQSLTAIITNVLENGKKILVVCEKKTALDVIYNNLKKLDLHKFVAIIDDVNRDRKKIIDRVRQVAENKREDQIRFNEQFYDRRLKKFTSMVNDFNHKHHNLLQTIFLGYNTQEIVAAYLKLKKEYETGERLLDTIDFQYNDEEYTQLSSAVEKATDLFDEVPNETLVYDILSCVNFEKEYSIQAENKLHELLKSEIEFLKTIHKEYFYLHNYKLLQVPPTFSFEYKQEELDEFAQNLRQLMQYWKNISTETKRIKENFDIAKYLNNNDLHKKIDELSLLNDTIGEYLNNLENINEQLYVIDLEKNKLPDTIDTRHINFNDSNWFNSIFSANHKAIRNFKVFYKNSCEIMRSLILDNQLSITEANLKTIVKDFVPLSDDIDNLTSKLENCIKNKNWYHEYHNWRFFFDNVDNLAQTCIGKLRKNGEQSHWLKIFKLNYTNLLVEQKTGSGDNFNFNSKAINKIGILQDDLKELHKYKIGKIWRERAEQAVNQYNKKSNIKWLFNYRKNSRYAKKNTLRAIIHEEFELFTDIFPVLLVNPVVCSSIFPLKPNLFELVLFDEASQLRLEDTYSALVRAKIKVISGDKHQMPPTSYFSTDIAIDAAGDEVIESETVSYDKTNPLFLAESESLLDFGNNLNPQQINTSFLDYHYRSKHPKLIDFSNAAFYGGRLIPMPEVTDYKPVRYFDVQGEYRKNNTNLDEANKIIDFLKNDYACNSDNSYPSLGIACFNMQQRNLIKDLIHEECVADEEFREKMNEIGKKEDWFVKNLENIQGDERDIIIISTTFGRNAEGNFRQSFGQINTAKGYKLLNVIITRAKKQVVVFSSIPSEYLSNYQDDIEKKGNKGKAILYAYIDYCRAIEMGNEAHRQNILKLLSSACEESKKATTIEKSVSAFKEEIFGYLQQHILPEKLIQNYQLGGYVIDFVITNNEGKPVVAIECDGASRHSSPQAFSHDLHRKKIFEMQGLHVFRIWSKAWHPNPNKALERFLVLLHKVPYYEEFMVDSSNVKTKTI